jgi:hypothetical protein
LPEGGTVLDAQQKNKQPPLHWPGIIWVVWNFFTVFNFAFAVVTILAIGFPFFERIPTEYMIPLKIIIIAGGVYAAFALAAAIAMLLKRKLGWILAFCVLGVSTLLVSSFGIGWTVAYGSDSEVFTATAFVLGVNVAWLVYFIKARRRYGVVS